MICHDQIPLIRLSLQRSLSNGIIDRKQYEEILRKLDEIENHHRETELRRNTELIRNLNKSLVFA